ELLGQAEAKLDALAREGAAAQLVGTIPGLGPRTAAAAAAPRPEPQCFATCKQVSAYVGAGAPAVPVRRGGPARPGHHARPGAVAPAPGRVRLGDAALQRLGAGGLPAPRPRPGAEEAGHRGGGAGAPGALPGNAAGRDAVAGGGRSGAGLSR